MTTPAQRASMNIANETKKILMQVLQTPYDQVCEVKIKLGSGEIVVQRVRVELSRARKFVEARGKAKLIARFKLLASVIRAANQPYDIVQFRRVKKETLSVELDDLTQLLQDVMSEEIAEAERKDPELKKIVIKRAGVTV